MTLEEMLALLPDNGQGEISAADLRAVVTDLHKMGTGVAQVFSYKWQAAGGPPAVGHITMDAPWSPDATQILISETTDDGQVLNFAVMRNASDAAVWITGGRTLTVQATRSGFSTDAGTYRVIPVTVDSVIGSPPLDESYVNVAVWVWME